MKLQQNGNLAAAEATCPRDSAWRHWYLVAVITVVVILNYVDRGVINLIVNPIKADLHLTDVEMSTLMGLSFVALYSVSSLPAGYFADRINRKLMMFFSILFWSMMLVVSGLAGSYGQLFAGRVGLGVGEAAMPPAAYSLIRDGVPPDKHARAYAIYGMGGSWGLGIGALFAGWLFASGTRGDFAGLPLLESLKPWQLVMAVPGLCGIVISLLVLTIREPPRRDTNLDTDRPTFREAARHLGAHWRIYVPLVVGVIFYLMAGGGFQGWAPSAISRKWGVSTAETAHVLGLLQVFLLPINNWTVGYLMDRFGRSGTKPERYLLIPILPILFSIVPASLYFIVPSVHYTWVMVGFYTACNCSTLAMTGTVLAAVTPGRLIGKMTALYFLFANLLGFAVGPTVFALTAEWLFDGPLAIIRAMQVCFPIGIVCAVVSLGYAARELQRSRRRQAIVSV